MEPGPIGPRSKALSDLRRLSGRRRERSDAGRFVIDGPTLVCEALDAHTAGGRVSVDVVYVEPAARPDVIETAHAAGVEVVHVADGALSKVTSPVTAQAVCARARIPEPVDPTTLHGLVLVLDAVADPGNAGTLVRAAEAAGASAVLFCGDGVDPWNPKSVRASAGSLFRLPVGHDRDTPALLGKLSTVGFALYATAGDGDLPLDDADLTGDVAVVLGNEAHGVSMSARALVDAALSVPMQGAVESLNVAMAGTVVAFEAARQRRHGR